MPNIIMLLDMLKKQAEKEHANRLADALLNKRNIDFWTEFRKIKGSSRQRPCMVD